MTRTAPLLVLLAMVLMPAWHASAGAPSRQTVCTVTVNSSDEKEAFRRSLPPGRFDFVELVEPGRSDWLASACRRGVRCDVLVISGHHDGESGFFSDRVEAEEYLSPDELERASCSDSCPGVFADLKEVYLFGCNTLNPEPIRSASAEVVRSLVRSGHPRPDAERIARALSERHADSTRERMRMIFKNVPAIYGFSSVAPLGPTAASFLNRYFRSGGSAEVATGRPSGRLVSAFNGHSLTAVRGLRESDPQWAYRGDFCQFYDERLSPAQKLAFVHELMHREMAEVRMFLDLVERYATSVPQADRRSPDLSEALARVAGDADARRRFLDFARDADQASTRARMIEIAFRLDWLTAEQKRAELVEMIADRLARDAITPSEVDLVCRVNEDRQLDSLRPRLAAVARPERTAHAAVLACLGAPEQHTATLAALTAGSDVDADLALAYVHRRPLRDAGEQRTLAAAIARMPPGRGQVRALDILAKQHVSDPATLGELTRLFARTDSVAVQTAIAGILIRADLNVIARQEVVQMLREHRLKGPGDGVLDALMRHLQPRPSVAQAGADAPLR